MRPSRPAVLLSAVLLPAAPAAADSPVADAAMAGDRARAEELLRAGADVNAARGDGMSALHWAAERGDADLTALLLGAGARVDAATRLGAYTPLHLAARNGAAGAADALLRAGADPDARTTTGGARPLHFAAAAGEPAIIESLLGRGAAIDARESVRGQTPLMFASAAGRLRAVEALLAGGADAAAAGHVVDLAARHGEDLRAKARRDQVYAAFREESGSPAGVWRPGPAQVSAAMRAAGQYLANGPEPDAEEEEPRALRYTRLVGTQGGLTALLLAAREGHASVAFALLDAGADIGQAGGDGTAPLLMALLNGHFDLALELLRRGADPNQASDAGAAPLYAALNTRWAPKARYPQQLAWRLQDAGYLEVMEALLDAGADPNARLERHLWYMEYTFAHLDLDTRGATPFWRAAHALDVPAMKLLTARGADPAIPTIRPPPEADEGEEEEEACSPLLLVRMFCDLEDALDGPDLDPSGLPEVPEGGPGLHPIHAATGHGYGVGFAGNSHRHAPDAWLDAARYLVETHGADVNARDHDGSTPLHNAASRGDDELIRYLVERGADPRAVNRRGQTTADLANGPVQRTQPYPETVALLESLGSANSGNCVSC